jgi:alcohol dehydrogenase (cytochrome c)
LGNRIFVGTLDAHLIALDATTGKVVWDAVVADYARGYSITSAPLAVDDMVVAGVAGGEFGIRGFVDAYDAASGQRRWRFYTVPAPGEPGSETWEGNSLSHGGAPPWLTGSFDPELRLIYWGVGNPSPNYNGQNRNGDNLYSD